MYTLSCLQVAYEFLNRGWMYLIYGEQKKTWCKSLKKWIDHCYFYMLDSINFKNDNQFPSKKSYKFLSIVIITSLGIFFIAYKVMKILLSLEEKKSVMEFQWCRNENSNKMSPTFHENNNESPQLTEDFTLGTSLTAIIKPTFRSSETWETIKANDDQQSSGNEDISKHDTDASGISKDMFDDMNSVENVDIVKPLIKCTSSLYVVTSKDSLNTELHAEFITKNTESQCKDNKKGNKIINNVNNNLTLAVHKSSSVFDVDDVNSSLYEDAINHYQYINLLSDTQPALDKNSSYISGHFVENFPDLDLSPIPNFLPKNRYHEQSLKIDSTDKKVEEAKLKNTGRRSGHQKYLTGTERGCSYQKILSDTGQGSSHQKYLSSSLTSSPRRLNKSSKKLTCFDFKTYLSEQKTFNRINSKIPRLNFAVEYEEAATKCSKLDVSKSKIPIPLRKSQITNVSEENELNESPKKLRSIQTEKKKETEIVDRLELTESDQSLKRFMQLVIALGCYSSSDFRHLQPFLSKS